MYEWLADAVGDDREVVTASRRLARELRQAWAERQLAEGLQGWPSPRIFAWQDWLERTLARSTEPGRLPLALGAAQSRLLWEEALSREIDDALLNVGNLVRLCREAWSRLVQWNVPLAECEASARSADQRLFCRVARRYRGTLERRGWADDSDVPRLLVEAVGAGWLSLPSRLTLAGFDRTTPQAESLIAVLAAAGVEVVSAGAGRRGSSTLVACPTRDAELRAAGAWARAALEADPGLRIGIVVTGLELEAARTARLLAEGLAPGWQYAGSGHAAAVNVSYGRRLADYPAITVAQLLLAWLHRDLDGRDVSLLLRSPLLGRQPLGGRSRLEIALRQLPDRPWSPRALLQQLGDGDDAAGDWLGRIANIAGRRESLPRRAAPSWWAACFDGVLEAANWPGEGTEDSRDFQLIDRWRELLGEFAGIELVRPAMSVAEATGRLATLAADTVFQPETDGAVVQAMGPLEAAGLHFDRLWVTGVTALDWPPQGRPHPLLSTALQRRHRMPDADPADTTRYAASVLSRLSASAGECRYSYAESDGESGQAPSGLVAGMPTGPAPADPGWHGKRLVGAPLGREPESVPPVAEDERIGGGAYTLDAQTREPFAAFVQGRLGLRPLPPIESGLGYRFRGIAIHDALRALYRELPSQPELLGWSAVERGERIEAAVDHAYRRHERGADATLGRLLLLERRRASRLLDAVLGIDCTRPAFRVAAVESRIDASIGGLRLSLRCDRLDRFDDGALMIIDYKTGRQKRLLSKGEPDDLQLVVYACAVDDPVAALALFNVDSLATGLDGAGRHLALDEQWEETLGRWRARVLDAAARFRQGDVRVNAKQGVRDARPLNLLSRYTEQIRER